jgi:2-hydroxy-6-oxonona-2,4-dienedioate hydrolase
MELKRMQLPNGETYAYREAGRGDKVLVLVHGNTSSSLSWDLLIAKLEDKYKIYAPDMRGFGDSTYNNPIRSIKDAAADLKLFVDGLGIKGFTIAGWSLGGPFVMQFVIDFPDYVNKMVLLEPGSIKGFPVPVTDAEGKIIPGKFVSSREDIEKIDAPFVAALVSKNFEQLAALFNGAVYNVHQPDPVRYKIYLEEACKQRNKVDADYAIVHFNISNEHNGVEPGTGEVDKITCPVLIFVGDQDRTVTVDMAQATARGIGDNARLVVLKNSAHSPLEDSLDIVVQEITEFV